VLGGRYRILGLLGRGGMGEVYRADDLKLEQPVALKFLPRALEGDPERLERLYGEVRMARQVSHPAVCRVWDVGEAEGQHFLSMEFVDGENLASLLRRIGRLPQDKALEIARQVAAGLAAAHEKGVLHRDLKPANVMLDGQGKVRLTDFGLAGLAEALSGDDVRSGTPSYMSPEQLQGREVTARSDIYALGLLVYELVTGRRAFEGKGLAELARKHRDERPIDPSAIVPELDPAVERTILACLEKDPRRRPPSALVVSAMLSGRDPLAAAIAAGETPSPELVAAAGETEGLRPRAAWACLLVVVLGALLLPATQGRRLLLARIPVEKGPEALEDRSRDLVARLVPGALAVDSEVGFSQDGDYLLWAQAQDRSAGRWASLGTGDPPVLSFWYRQSPRPLAPTSLPGVVGWNDPPVRVVDMAGAEYDLQGRLLSFYAVPPQRERESGPSREPDWAPLFAEARLDPSQFRPVEPRWTPPHHSDTRAAWEGVWPRRPEILLRVEAAAYRGRPVWFETVNPWTRPEREQAFPFTAGQRGMQAFYVLVMATLVAVGGLLAYRNIRLGRGDRRGAFRLAMALATMGVASWALRAHHVSEPAGELVLFARGAGIAVLVAALLWLFYLALEPYVRRLRPWTLVSWARLLEGGTRDAVVGRDVLIGLAWGTVLALLGVLSRAFLAWLGRPERPPELLGIDALLSTRLLLSYVAGLPVNATLVGLALLLLFLVLRLVTRRDLVAAALVVAFLVSSDLAEARENAWLMLPFAVAAWAAFVGVMLRFGVLAAITAILTANLLSFPPLLYAPGSWTGAATLVVLPLLVVLAVLAFRSAVGGHSGLRRYLALDAPSSSPR
jgi:serine/threonine-protein kinase